MPNRCQQTFSTIRVLPVYLGRLEIWQIQFVAVPSEVAVVPFSHHLGTSVLHAHRSDRSSSVTTCSEKNVYYIPFDVSGAAASKARESAQNAQSDTLDRAADVRASSLRNHLSFLAGGGASQ